MCAHAGDPAQGATAQGPGHWHCPLRAARRLPLFVAASLVGAVMHRGAWTADVLPHGSHCSMRSGRAASCRRTAGRRRHGAGDINKLPLCSALLLFTCFATVAVRRSTRRPRSIAKERPPRRPWCEQSSSRRGSTRNTAYVSHAGGHIDMPVYALCMRACRYQRRVTDAATSHFKLASMYLRALVHLS